MIDITFHRNFLNYIFSASSLSNCHDQQKINRYFKFGHIVESFTSGSAFEDRVLKLYISFFAFCLNILIITVG